MSSRITFDAGASGRASSSSTDFSWPHTVAAGSGRALCVGVTHNQNVDVIATYAGVEMTEGASVTAILNNSKYLYLSDPPAGTADVHVYFNPAADNKFGASASYQNVDVDGTPFRTFYTDGPDTNAKSITVADAQAGDLISSFANLIPEDGTLSWAEGETQRQTTTNTSTTVSLYMADLDVDDFGSTTGYTVAGSSNYGHILIAVAMAPAPTGRNRAIKYFYDINNPQGRIIDELGRVVMPWEIRANNWIRVSGLFPPSSTKYESFTKDPEVAYIEEVTFSSRGGLRLKTSSGELTEVLMARAAGGKTL